MDMSDTPETDGVADFFVSGAFSTNPDNKTVPLEFSRKLERERDEARDVVTILCDGEPKRDFAKECKRLECELERVHNEFLIVNDKMVNAECEAREIASAMEKVKQERDELRKKYENLATENMLQINKLCNERDDAIAERDIARLSALDSDRAHDRMVGELERIYKERDSLIESSKYWQEMYEAVSTF